MGRHGANLDKAFAVADKAGSKLTQQIFEAHKGDAEITFKAAQRRYNAHCKETEARSYAAAQVNAPSHGRRRDTSSFDFPIGTPGSSLPSHMAGDARQEEKEKEGAAQRGAHGRDDAGEDREDGAPGGGRQGEQG